MEAISLALHLLNWPVSVYVLLAAPVVYLIVQLNSRPPFPPGSPVLLKGYPVVGLLKFFTARPDIFHYGAAISKTGNFSFYYGKKRIVGLQGDEGRKAYFESKGLNIAQGTNDLFICGPTVDLGSETETFHSWAFCTLKRCLQKENFVKLLSKWTNDTQCGFQDLKARKIKVTNPFDDIFQIMYQMSMRTVGADDIADDRPLLLKTLYLFEQFENSMSPARIIFPWLPTPSYLWRMAVAGRLGMLIAGIIKKRRKTGVRGNDPLQTMVDQGDTSIKIASFVIGAGFAGLNNSGINIAWLLCYLAEYPEWQERVRAEVYAIVAKHGSNKEDALQVLSKLTVDEWESELPLIELCLLESVRLGTTGTAFRKNTSGTDIPIGMTKEIIPKDSYAIFLLDDVHMNPEIYPDPFKFDPGRYLPDRAEDQKKPIGYYGWGAGRYPCLGMRFAKLSMSIIVAYAVAMFDFQVSDKDGNPTTVPVPRPDRSRHLANKPKKEVYLRYQPR